jgi:hypothetical protein
VVPTHASVPGRHRLRPAIERELGQEIATRIFLTNPARAFQADW